MIRITNTHAQAIRELCYDLEQTARQQGVPTPPIIERAAEVSRVIEQQLAAPNHDGNLVDTIAKILNELPPGAALSGTRLIRLRGAVLSPLELAQVLKEAGTTVTCTGCGIDLGPGSLMTHYNGGVRCLACMAPDSIHARCTGTNHTKVVELPDTVKKRLRLLLKKTDCPTCVGAANTVGGPGPTLVDAPDVAPTPTPDGPRVATGNPIFGAGAGAAPPPTPPPYTRAPQVLRQTAADVLREQRERGLGLRAGRAWTEPVPVQPIPRDYWRGIIREDTPFGGPGPRRGGDDPTGGF